MKLNLINEKHFDSEGNKYSSKEIYNKLLLKYNNPTVFGTYVNIPMLKINPSYKGTDPAGLYAYPIKELIKMQSQAHFGFGNRKYLILFNADIYSDGVLHFNKKNKKSLNQALKNIDNNNVLQNIKFPYEEEALLLGLLPSTNYISFKKEIILFGDNINGRIINDDAYIWKAIENLAKTKGKTYFSTAAMNKLGIWAAIDHGTGTMGEPYQGMFLDVSKLNQLKTIDQYQYEPRGGDYAKQHQSHRIYEPLTLVAKRMFGKNLNFLKYIKQAVKSNDIEGLRYLISIVKAMNNTGNINDEHKSKLINSLGNIKSNNVNVTSRINKIIQLLINKQ